MVVVYVNCDCVPLTCDCMYSIEPGLTSYICFILLSELSTFSDFARDLIMQLPYAVPLPEEGSVFDYYLNLRQYQFLPWADRKGNSGGDISSSGYVSLPEVSLRLRACRLNLGINWKVYQYSYRYRDVLYSGGVSCICFQRRSDKRVPLKHTYLSCGFAVNLPIEITSPLIVIIKAYPKVHTCRTSSDLSSVVVCPLHLLCSLSYTAGAILIHH